MTPIKYNIRSQRIQWLGHIIRGSDDKLIKTVLFWKPADKWPRGHPWKRWMDVDEKDLKIVGVNDWRNIIHDREKWVEVVIVAKTLVE